jgi:hypothetical protein
MAADLLAKVVWTEADFSEMGWHDAVVHAIGFDDDGGTSRLLLDLDYIVRWLEPEPPRAHYSFAISPVTLVFDDVSNLEGEVGIADGDGGVLPMISDISRGDSGDDKADDPTSQRWVIDGGNFELTFCASGFRQHFRAWPTLVHDAQRLTSAARGGISFDQPTQLR